MTMLKLLWNALKASSTVFGLSLLIASSSYAAESPVQESYLDKTAAATTNEATVAGTPAVEPKSQLSETPVEDSVSLATPTQASSTSLNLQDSKLPQTAQTPVETLSTSQMTGSAVSPTLNPEATTLAQATPTPNSNTELLEQINRYNNEGKNNSQNQVTNVGQLTDVSPGDWAYEALRSLVERYGCIVGYPDGTFRGNRATTRFEFAAGLNACLNQIERLIATATEGFVRREDLETLQRLVQEFQSELTALRGRVDTLEGRVAELEENQFSTTTKLNGEIYFALADIFGAERQAVPSRFNPANADDVDGNTIFANRVRLNFDTSFTGRDRLRTRLQARNINSFDRNETGTDMTEFAITGGGNNDVELNELSYRTALTEAVTFYMGTEGLDQDDIHPNLMPTADFGISDFGQVPPVYKMSAGAGAGLTFGANSPIRIDVSYLVPSEDASSPAEGDGIFNGAYAATGQITFQPVDAFRVAATYVHGYGVSPGGGDGSRFANAPFGQNPFSANADGDPDAFNNNADSTTTSNAYYLSAQFRLGQAISIGGFAGTVTALDEENLGAGSRQLWTYGGGLTFNDIGGEGNELGLVFGMPPRNRTGPVIGRRDRDTSYHAEAYFKLQLNENIAIIPGAFVILNPEHNEANDDIYVGTIQTLFTF
jgi:hypothetical protein